MEKKEKTAGTISFKSRLIGIVGTGHSVGCTHFSIMLLNYLAGYLRRNAALLEFNPSGDMARLEEICTGTVQRNSPCRILEADYYKNAGLQELEEALKRKYEDILIDFGTAAEGNMGEFWRCDRRFVVGSFSEWQQESFREFEMGNRVSGRKSWKSLAVFGSEETRREFKRRYRIETERIPFSADAFAVTEECGRFFGKIIAEK